MSKARDLADLAKNANDRLDAVASSDGALSNRNLIINGAMQVAQRGTSFTGITTTAYHTVDRFKTAINLAGTWTATQEPNGPDGFTKSLKYECTTANTSLNANAYAIITHDIEAQNLQHLQYGSSGAKTLTLSFYVKSNKTGTYSHEISHSDVSSPSTSYYNASQFTINAADTWEYKTIQIAGQTVDQIDNDNGRGLSLNFWFVAGSAFTTGTYNANTWHGTAADRAVGVVNLADTVGNYIQLAGVQLEVGDTATPFEHRPYSDQLHACRRYYQIVVPSGGGHIWASAITTSDYQYRRASTVNVPTMRVAPTARNITGTISNASFKAGSPKIEAATAESIVWDLDASTGAGAAYSYLTRADLDAEL